MWSPSYLYYVVCPRTSKFMDYLPGRLREDFAKDGMRPGPDGELPRRTPLVEVKVLACRAIAPAGRSLERTEETTASVTLTDPQSGLVVGTAICIGLTSSPVLRDRSHTRMPAPAPRTSLRWSTRGVAPAKISSSCAGRRVPGGLLDRRERLGQMVDLLLRFPKVDDQLSRRRQAQPPARRRQFAAEGP